MSGEDRKLQPVDDWFEYKRLVLAALEQTAKQNELLNKRLTDIEMAVIQLQTKASTWGGVAGVVSGAVCSILVVLILKAIGVH